MIPDQPQQTTQKIQTQQSWTQSTHLSPLQYKIKGINNKPKYQDMQVFFSL